MKAQKMKVMDPATFIKSVFAGQKEFSDVNLSYLPGHQNIDFSGTKFVNIVMNISGFYRCNFENCTFIGSNLRCCTFRECNFKNCKFIDTDMGGVDLLGSNLDDAVFDNVDFTAAFLDGVDFHNVKKFNDVNVFTVRVEKELLPESGWFVDIGK